MSNPNTGPQRIVCLTDETTETLYLVGEERRIVGVSGFSSRPIEARQKPKVSTFKAAKMESILQLEPDLVIGFSHIQAQIAHDLIQAGINVLMLNHRSLEEICEMILTLSRMVAAESAGLVLVEQLRGGLTRIAQSASRFPRRPRVFFEEWMDPLISGIEWVQELIEVAGGEIVFPQLRHERNAKGRAVESGAVAKTDPEVIIGSWCGKQVNKETIRGRDGWEQVRAIRNGHIYEIKSSYILQPGPAALSEGVRHLHAILAVVVGCEPLSGLEPAEDLDPDLAALGRTA